MNQAEQSFIKRLRGDLEQRISDELLALARNNTDRNAGHVSGLMDCQKMIDGIIQDMTRDDRPSKQEQ